MARDTEFSTSVSEQASHWWEVFHDEDASPADHREFGEWVARSPERVEAYLQTARLMQALKSPDTRWPSTPADVLIREAKAAPQDALPISRGKPVPAVEVPRARETVRTRFVFALAAMLLVGFGVAWLMLQRPQQFSTQFGEQLSVLLDDGSRVTLNTASKIEVTLRKNHRMVRLVQGEALFEVAHDASRPFDVSTGNAVLRAVGTQFDVDVRPSQTTVTVVEGVVAMVHGGGGGSQHAELPTLAAADRVVITAAGPGTTEHGVHVSAAIAWMQRQLVFEHRPLGEVAEEFNRYNRDRITIESAELQGQEITGVFQSNDAASFVSFLSGIPGVVIRDDGRGGHVVTLEDNKEPAAP
jgi:transmembrane sensor